MAKKPQTSIDLYEKWIAAKTESPLISRTEFIEKANVSERALRKALRGTDASAREWQIAAGFVAKKIEECAKELKMHPRDLDWYQFREWAKVSYGHNAIGLTPKHITVLGGFNRIRDNFFAPVATPLQVEREALTQGASLSRQIGKELAREALMRENAEEWASRVFRGIVGKAPLIKVQEGVPVKQYIHALWSDLHYGSDLLAENTGVADYTILAESRRTSHFVHEIAAYDPQNRANQVLKYLLNGDIFEGKIHANDAAALTMQWLRSLRLQVQAIRACSRIFSKVEVECQVGNHGRDPMKHQSRATFDKWDGPEGKLYLAIREACHDLPNVKFTFPKTSFSIYDAFGKFFMTHGDGTFNAGNPGNQVNVASWEAQTNSVNSFMRRKFPGSSADFTQVKAFLFGHTHEPIIKPLRNGSKVIGNGCMVPPNGFATSLGIFDYHCSQWIWDSVEGSPVNKTREVVFNTDVDEKTSLDKLIKPFQGWGK